MTEKVKTPSSKTVFLLLLIVFVGGIIAYVYLYMTTTITKRLVIAELQKTNQINQEISAFSNIPGFDKLQLVKNLEEADYQMPRSDYIEAVLEIFDTILNVDTTESSNIVLSDFKISLEEISLHGYVSNLRLLYNSPDPGNKTALIDKFEQLDFLENISIRTYERAGDRLGYEFVLTAKVVNNANTK